MKLGAVIRIPCNLDLGPRLNVLVSKSGIFLALGISNKPRFQVRYLDDVNPDPILGATSV